MKMKIAKMSLLFVLLTGLTTSSFFLRDYLTNAITNKNFNQSQLSYAVAHENIAALNFALQQSSFHSEQWVIFAKALAKTQGKAAYLLGNYYQRSSTKKTIFWYKHAIRLNYMDASIALAKLYFDQEEILNASKLLDDLPKEVINDLTIQSVILKIHIAINQGSLSTVEELIKQYFPLLTNTTDGQSLLVDMNKYQVLANVKEVNKVSLLSPRCANSIQLFATTIKHLKQLEAKLLAFQQKAINNVVCFSPVRYIPVNALDCNNDISSAIRCNEIGWEPLASSIKTRYVGVMLPKGGANVHFGILYFDTHDTIDVIAHEISHLLGFVDEYPVADEHVKCQAPQKESFSLNIAVLKNHYYGEQKKIRAKLLKEVAWAKHIKDSTPILQAVTDQNGVKLWQLGTPNSFEQEVGIFTAKTCEKSILGKKFSAYKGVSHRTKMEYFALAFPEVYSSLLKQNPIKYRMPSFHYNIALAYSRLTSQENSELSQVAFWLEQAISWEDNLERQKKVRRGAF